MRSRHAQTQMSRCSPLNKCKHRPHPPTSAVCCSACCRSCPTSLLPAAPFSLFPVVLEALRTKRMKPAVPSPIPRLLQSLPPFPSLASSPLLLVLPFFPPLLSFCHLSTLIYSQHFHCSPRSSLCRRVSSLPPPSSRCLTTTQPDLSSVLRTLSQSLEGLLVD